MGGVGGGACPLPVPSLLSLKKTLTERRHGVRPKLGVGQQVGGQVLFDKVGGVRAAVAWKTREGGGEGRRSRLAEGCARSTPGLSAPLSHLPAPPPPPTPTRTVKHREQADRVLKVRVVVELIRGGRHGVAQSVRENGMSTKTREEKKKKKGADGGEHLAVRPRLQLTAAW